MENDKEYQERIQAFLRERENETEEERNARRARIHEDVAERTAIRAAKKKADGLISGIAIWLGFHRH